VVISIYNTRENILAQLKCFQPSGEIGKSQSAIKASAKSPPKPPRCAPSAEAVCVTFFGALAAV